MKAKMGIGLVVLTALFFSLCPELPAVPPPAVGGTLPNVELPGPKDGADRRYLGLSGAFKIPDIKARAVIVEIFSMYCPYCQKEAPVVNQLFARIEGNPALKGKIKMLGIGMGNSPFEVGVFKKKYGVAFPLFPDPDFVIHKRMGEVRTPYFIVIRILPNGGHRVVYSKLGAFGDVDAFLAAIVRDAGIQ